MILLLVTSENSSLNLLGVENGYKLPNHGHFYLSCMNVLSLGTRIVIQIFLSILGRIRKKIISEYLVPELIIIQLSFIAIF